MSRALAPDEVAARPAIDIADLLAKRAFQPVFTPVVRLDSLAVVGFEAGVRAFVAGRLVPHQELVAAAIAAGRAAELDWVSRGLAYQAALDARVHASQSLFVESDLRALIAACPPDLAATVWKAESKLRVVMQISPAMVAADPLSVPAAMARARRIGWGIGMDASTEGALALVPVVRPDVIKLPISTLRRPPSPGGEVVASSVLEESEWTEANVFVTGIESKHDLNLARAVGASLGTGPVLGAPEPLGPSASLPTRPVRLLTAPDAAPRTPYELLGRSLTSRPATYPALVALSRHVEDVAARSTEPMLVIATFQSMQGMTPRTVDRYAALAAGGAIVAMLGPDMPRAPAPGVTGTPVEPGDRVAQEWNVFAVSAHLAVGLSARLRDAQPELFLTYDRGLVLDAIRPLLDRVESAPLARDDFSEGMPSTGG